MIFCFFIYLCLCVGVQAHWLVEGVPSLCHYVRPQFIKKSLGPLSQLDLKPFARIAILGNARAMCNAFGHQSML